MLASLSKISEFGSLRSLHSTGSISANLSPEEFIRVGIDYFNNMKKQQCISAFELMLDKFPSFTTGRIVYSNIAERLGDISRSCRILTEGLQEYSVDMDDTERENQYRLLLSLGKQRLKIWSNFSEYDVGKLILKSKKENLEKAYECFSKGLMYFPKKVVSIEMSARCLEGMKKHEEALELWGKIREKNKEYLKRYIVSLGYNKRVDEMNVLVKKMREEYPRDPFCYMMLGKREVDKDKKVEFRRMEMFYRFFPDWCEKVEYDEKNYEVFCDIVSKNKKQVIGKRKKEEKNIYFVKFEETFEKLLEDKSIVSSEFIIAMIYNHIAAGSTTNRAFSELFVRSEKEDVQKLLNYILENQKTIKVSPSVIKHIISILSKRKYPKLYERIIKLLNKDMELFDMGIPRALANLGNTAAIEHLIAAVNVELKKKPKNCPNGLGSIGHMKLRQRCCLALSFFDAPEIPEILKKACEIECLKVHSLAALYKLTKDKKYFEKVEEITKQKKNNYVGYDIFVFLKENCQNDDVNELTKSIAEQYNDQHKKEIEISQQCVKNQEELARELEDVIVKTEEDNVEEKKEEVPVEEKEADAPVEEKKEDVPVEEKKEDAPVEEKKEDVPVEEKKEDVPVEEKKEDVPVEEKKEDALVAEELE